VIPEQVRARTHTHLLSFLGSAASACGSAVNSVLVHFGDAFGLYPTGQYSFDDHELPHTSPRARHWWKAGFRIGTQSR
jgi:hypothetical protein